jgi:beta-lactamase class C
LPVHALQRLSAKLRISPRPLIGILSGLLLFTVLTVTLDAQQSGSADEALAFNAGAYSQGSGLILRDASVPPLLPALLVVEENAPGLPDFSLYTTWLRQQVEEIHLPGVAMAIVSSKGILSLETWGVRAAGKDGAVDADTIFRIASVSKTFAGTVAAQLVQQQAYSWDEPLFRILPQYRFGTAELTEALTLRHVLSHSSGLMPHAYSNMLDAGVSYQKIQEKFHEIPVVCPPGRCYGYQNVVFSLVSDVVQMQTQKSYEEFVRENIFAPLGMRTASLTLEEYLANANASSPHQRSRDTWRVATTNAAYYTTGPASGVNASILDMSRWAQANLGAFPEVIPRSLLEVQHSPVVETPRGSYFNRWPKLEKAYYGLGWRVFDYAGLRVVHHGGGVRGFRTELALVPELDLALVVLFNGETALANDVVPGFLDQLLLSPGAIR